MKEEDDVGDERCTLSEILRGKIYGFRRLGNVNGKAGVRRGSDIKG